MAIQKINSTPSSFPDNLAAARTYPLSAAPRIAASSTFSYQERAQLLANISYRNPISVYAPFGSLDSYLKLMNVSHLPLSSIIG